MAAYHLLELPSIPKHKNQLQALINAARYAQKRARRYKWGLWLAIIALAALLYSSPAIPLQQWLYVVIAESAYVLYAAIRRLRSRDREDTPVLPAESTTED